jgi:hypothetical protein
MSYTNKEELLKLGEIDSEFAAVRSWKPSPLRAPSSGLCRSLRSLIYRHPTIRISMPSRKWSKGARRKGLKRSVLFRQISSRPTTWNGLESISKGVRISRVYYRTCRTSRDCSRISVMQFDDSSGCDGSTVHIRVYRPVPPPKSGSPLIVM